MNAIVIDRNAFGKNKDQVIEGLKEKGVDTRLLFCGMARQKSLRDYGADCTGAYPVTDWLSENGFYLPSASSLKEEEIEYICETIKRLQRD